MLGIQPVVWAGEEAGPDRPCRSIHTEAEFEDEAVDEEIASDDDEV